jgi:hypothetical protein
MSSEAGEIVGTVLYTAGDGVEQKIPLGSCEIESTSTDVTISWRDGETSGVANMPLDNYTVFLVVWRVF